jgi:hypothetical protein
MPKKFQTLTLGREGGGVHFEDDTTAAMRARGIEVDDDNEPAPENVPRQEAMQAECQYGEWGFDGIDNRHVGNHSNTGASFVGMSKEKFPSFPP